MIPTVGRIVHFYDVDGVGPIAAIVTQVGGMSETHVALDLFWPPTCIGRLPKLDNVPFHEGAFGSGYWVNVGPPRSHG